MAAHNIGIGCCWVMHFNPEAIREAFSVPPHIHPTALLVMGHPTEDAKPHAFHETFRPMEDVVSYETF